VTKSCASEHKNGSRRGMAGPSNAAQKNSKKGDEEEKK
jgi:hypothetical protein